MVALALVGAVALVVMNIAKQGINIQKSSVAGNDEAELMSMLRMLLSKSQHCNESIKHPATRALITFNKADVDEPSKGEGADIEIYQTAADGSAKKFLSTVPGSPESKFGKLEIKKIKLLMNNGVGFNYPPGASHSDNGIIRLVFMKPSGDKQVPKTTDISLNVGMSTDGAGLTTAQSCAKDVSGIVRKDATVENMLSSAYVNNFDQEFTYTCPGDKVICGEFSYHNNHNEDRRYSFSCCDVKLNGENLAKKSCSWSGQVNDYDLLLNYTCPNNAVMAGHFSHHDNIKEDRVYQFYCCEMGSANQKAVLEECEMPTAWANNWDGVVNNTCAANKVRVGEHSIHNNHNEDRIHKFKCCKVVVEEAP